MSPPFVAKMVAVVMVVAEVTAVELGTVVPVVMGVVVREEVVVTTVIYVITAEVMETTCIVVGNVALARKVVLQIVGCS